MPDDDDIGAKTASGRETDLGGSRSGGSSGDQQFAAGEDTRGRSGDGSPISAEEAEQADTDSIDETPDDLKLGTRRTAGVDEDEGGGTTGA